MKDERHEEVRPAPTLAERWLARLAFLSASGALAAVFAGVQGGVAVLSVGLVGVALTLAGAWWFLANRGVVRWLAAGLVVAAPVIVVVVYVANDRVDDIVVATNGRSAG